MSSGARIANAAILIAATFVIRHAVHRGAGPPSDPMAWGIYCDVARSDPRSVTFGLDTLIMSVAAHPERTGDVASQATVLRLGLTIVYCAVLLGVTVFSAYPHETRVIIGIYGLAYILDNLYGVARSVFHAHQQMVYGAAIEVGRDLINVAASLVAIHLGWSLPAIVAISAVVSLAKLLAGWAVLRLRFARFTLRIRRRDAIAMLQRAMPFAAVLALGVLYAQMNTVMLSWWKPEEAVGLFSAAVMPVGILLIVPSMFMESIFPAFSAYADAGSPGLVRAYRASFRALLLIGLAMGAGTMVVAGPVIGIIYGPDFAGAAPVLRVLAIQLLSMVGYVNGALLQATGARSPLRAYGWADGAERRAVPTTHPTPGVHGGRPRRRHPGSHRHVSLHRLVPPEPRAGLPVEADRQGRMLRDGYGAGHLPRPSRGSAAGRRGVARGTHRLWRCARGLAGAGSGGIPIPVQSAAVRTLA